MSKREVLIDEDHFSSLVAEDLLWHAENADNKAVRKACWEVAIYYMTFDQLTEYLGCPEVATEEFFKYE